MSLIRIQQIVREAEAAFSQDITHQELMVRLNNLVRSVGPLQASDVNLNESLASASPYFSRASASFYIDVFSSKKFAISISTLNPGVNFPLHDTPGMYGIVKVIKGYVNISTYTAVADDNANIAVPQDVLARVNTSQRNNDVFIPVNKHKPMLLAEYSQPCILSPEKGNFHKMCAIGYQAAFIKVLVPPYDMVNRIYTFYKALQTAEEDATITTWLVKSRPDSMFFSSALPYRGPQIECLNRNV